MNHNNVATHLLSQSAFWRLPKIFVDSLGVRKGFILTDLIDKSEYFTSTHQDEDGWFYYVQKSMLDLHGVSADTMRKSIDDLEKLQLIEVRLVQEGLTRKNYYRIKADNIQFFIKEKLIEKSQNNEL